MKLSTKLAALLTIQFALVPFLTEQKAYSQEPIVAMSFNQANALNSELFQNQWGDRVAGSSDDEAIGPVNTPTSGDKNTKSPIVPNIAFNPWNFFLEGNGIFAQKQFYHNNDKINGGGVTAELSYQWNSSITTGLYVGYQGSQMTQNLIFPGILVANKYNLTDNAARFGFFGSYGQQEGKGFYGLGLLGGTYHQYSDSGINRYKLSNGSFAENESVNSASSEGAPELDSMLAGGYDFKASGLTFGPTTGIQYTYLYFNGVTVSGADSYQGGNYTGSFIYQYRIRSSDTSTLLYSLGVHAAYTWNPFNDCVIVPQINLNWQHQFLYTVNGESVNVEWPDALYTGVGVTAA